MKCKNFCLHNTSTIRIHIFKYMQMAKAKTTCASIMDKEDTNMTKDTQVWRYFLCAYAKESPFTQCNVWKSAEIPLIVSFQFGIAAVLICEIISI